MNHHRQGLNHLAWAQPHNVTRRNYTIASFLDKMYLIKFKNGQAKYMLMLKHLVI